MTNDEIEELRVKLPAYIKSTPELQFRKHLVTYLNQKAWNDRIIEKIETGSTELEQSRYNPQIPQEDLDKYA